jgi:hypothetical protein
MGPTGRRTRGALQKDLLQMQGACAVETPAARAGKGLHACRIAWPGQVQVKCSEMGDPGAA